MKNKNIQKALIGVSVIGIIGFGVTTYAMNKNSECNITTIDRKHANHDLLDSISNANFECVVNEEGSALKYQYRTSIINHGMDDQEDVEIKAIFLTKDGKELHTDKFSIPKIEAYTGVELSMPSNLSPNEVYKIKLEKY